MAEPKPANEKARFLRRVLLSLLAIAVIVASAVMTMPKPAAPEFRRYVGPPLPDGSRVTFLYPTSLDQSVNSPNTPRPWAGFVQDVQMVKPPGLREVILWRLPFWQQAHSADDLLIGMLATKIPARMPVISGRSTSKRIQRTIKRQENIYVEDVSVTNAKTKTQCDFDYEYLAPSTPSAAFVKHEAMITNSFQVLPPEAAVPKP